MPYPGQPENEPIPPRLDRWNWGAFFLNWIWGLGNSTYIALLMFVPIVNIVMIFVLGAKGSQLAWKNRLWRDEEHFRRTQRNWARAGLLIFLTMVFLVWSLFSGLSTLLKNNPAYIETLELINNNTEIVALMGSPIEADGFFSGNVAVTPTSGTANFSIPVSGPNCSGTVISRAEKTFGNWEIYLLVLNADCNNKTYVLINSRGFDIPNEAQGISL